MTPTIPHRYRPAESGWLALCREDLVLGVELAPDDARADALWTLVLSTAGSAELLDELTRGGISATPSFVLIDRTEAGRARVLVRGDARVTVGGSEVDGRQTSGWAETSAAESDPVAVETTPGGSAELPIVRGAVRFSGLAIGQAEPVVAAPESVPAATPKVAHTPAASPAPAEATISATTVVELSDEEMTPVLPARDAEPGGYDHLFGETMYRSVEGAAIRAEPEAADPDDRIDDRTIVAADLAAARARRRTARRTRQPEPAAPRLHLDLSTGGREVLDRPLIIGRAPQSERVSDGNVPRLVSMTTPNQDISRTHVRVAVEGGTVVVTDLHSRNGTMVQLPGKAPQQLRAGEPTPVTIGTVIDLGDGATLTVGEEA
jgi:hypothetical protein